MKLNIALGALSLGILCAITSCSLDSDYSTYTYSDDTAITAVSFGKLTRTMHTTTKAGKDSTYISTYTGSVYPISIDQKTRTIFNADSLPYGTDPAKILLSVSTKNSASAYLVKGDTAYTFIQSTDTIDFTNQQKIAVVSQDGMNRCDYKMTVTVHKEDADSFTWSPAVTDDVIKTMENVRAVALNDKIFCLGTKFDTTPGYTEEAAADLLCSSINGAFAPSVVRSFAKNAQITASDNDIYVLSNGTLCSSSDEGATWNDVANAEIASLVAAHNNVVYAINNAGTLVESADNGVTWTASAVDEKDAPLPMKNACAFVQKVKTNDDMTRLTIIGTPADDSQAYAAVWSRLYDGTLNSAADWMYQPWEPSNSYKLAALGGLSTTSYGEYMLAIGELRASIGKNGETADYAQIYTSIDHGLTWKNDKSFRLPKGFEVKKASNAAIVADKNNILWIICGGTGQVWHGRLHRMTWKEQQTYFQ